MKKRLDIQSLLAKCSKEDIDNFLKTRFKKNKQLETDFLIHFAGTFDLDEDQFSPIVKRIENLIPRNPKKANTKVEQMLVESIHNLIEQSRDCLYSNNYNQCFIILSHCNVLLEKVLTIMPDPSKFEYLLSEVYRITSLLYKESPARSLKLKIENHLLQIASNQECYLPHNQLNPYSTLYFFEPKSHGKKVLPILLDRLHSTSSGNAAILLYSTTQIACQMKDWTTLIDLLQHNGQGEAIYNAMIEYKEEGQFPKKVMLQLEDNYKGDLSTKIKKKLYLLLSTQNTQEKKLFNLAVAEYFRTGLLSHITTLKTFQSNPDVYIIQIIEYYHNHPTLSSHRFYELLEFLGYLDLLKDQLKSESNIFVFIHHAKGLREFDSKFIQTKLWELTHHHLSTHFGRPAVDWLDQVSLTLTKNNISYLQDFLFTNIKNNFGHRRHFQKLMKEIA